MATILKAGNVATGAQITSDATGILEVRTGTGAGTTAITVGTDQAVAIGGNNISAVNSLGFRNRIINGDCRIDQRNNGASVTIPATTSQFTLDRWMVQSFGANKFSVQQTPSATETGFGTRIAAGFQNYLGITSLAATSSASGDYYALFHFIEGFNVADLAWGTSAAKPIVLSFLVYSSLTGTFSGSLKNSADNRSYVFTYTVSAANTWTTININISGDTTGTWLVNNGKGLALVFDLGSGTSYRTTAGSWQAGNFYGATGATSVVATNGATFYITGVQLEAGSVATPFERRDYGRELMMCQRYYEKGSAGAGSRSTDNICYTYINYKQEKRAVPTFAGVSQTVNVNYTDSVQCYQAGLGGGSNSLFTWTSSAEL
jgi:hypothetical protein